MRMIYEFYLTSGIKETEKEIAKFDEIKKMYPDITMLFIDFSS